ncbi:MAG: hypothetical protein R3C68_13905 [Myxococcota bacterium]
MEVAAERLPLMQAIYNGTVEPPLTPPSRDLLHTWDKHHAVIELVRCRLEVLGRGRPLGELSLGLHIPEGDIDIALAALEAEGFVMRGMFRKTRTGRPNGASVVFWRAFIASPSIAYALRNRTL